MKLRRDSKAAAVLVCAVGSALMSGGTAYAFWTTSGTGTASAKATTAQGLTVTSPSVTGLYPTGSVSGTFTVTNGNPFKVTLTDATLGALAVDSAHAACNVASVSVALGAIPTSALAASTGSASVPFTASMTNAALNECQGATFTVTATINAQSAS